MRKSFKLVGIALAVMLAHPALSEESQPQEGASAQSKAMDPVAYAGRAITVTGTIESVDRETRAISIKDQESRLFTIRADGKMDNFEELEKGDKVLVRYSEAMLVTIARSDAGAEARVETPAVETAPATPPRPRGEPAAQALEQTRIVAKVTDIAADGSRITLQGPKDEEIALRVRDPKAVADLKKGDAVIASYVEALAVSVVPEDDAAGEARVNQAPIEQPQQPRAREPDGNRPQADETR